jgi:hypothetical protein
LNQTNPNSGVYPANLYAVDRPWKFSMQHKQVYCHLPGLSPWIVLLQEGGKGMRRPELVPVILPQVSTTMQHPPPLLSSRGNQRLEILRSYCAQLLRGNTSLPLDVTETVD